ncbi:methylated-DNA--[protein]-cysteine S-methyltransferase [Falsarthrobacter nasiphocae]|uniref:Methylated-DNA-[protein]-cysteine S-methyltransferase n=1 Tax=Falsarthrobacter nasiphocae TaxID=189863 RepID=A0AAE4C6H1_9MICC|nr:methylated-DNA--[protein]-cysteine S-methyltransferase [Falsarthrobacter nasiphocae]MDR6892162.1 methylated-DNA-[protein]-cysteine S-methyltransferase [Falsarthrobacter nasiphocae]
MNASPQPSTTAPSSGAASSPDHTPAVTATLTTEDGPFTVIASDGHVLASGWTNDVWALRELIHARLRPAEVDLVDDDDERITHALNAVRAYYAGDLDAPAAVPVRQDSAEFRAHAWDVLRQVGPGAPVTYAEYAERAGRPAAVRAAAGACASNAAALFVPCHRVVRTGGGMGGFRYGTEIKERLLAREAGRLPLSR